MKVFIDCRWYAQPGQGVVTYLAGLHRSAEAALLGLSENRVPEFWYGVETMQGLDAQLLPSGVRALPLGRHGMLWRLFVLPFVLRRHGFDAAHFQYVCPLLKLGMRYVTTIHDVLFLQYPEFFSLRYRLPRQVLFMWSAKSSDLVLTVSEQSAQAIAALLRPSRAPVVVHNGAGVVHDDIAPVPVAGLAPRGFLLTVGRVEPRKNYVHMAKAFALSDLANQGATLVVVGFCTGEFAQELAQFRDTPGVVWLDRVSDAELAWLYAQARGFVYPSVCEGFGIPVLEALRYRLPCAISNTFPLADVVASVPLTFNPHDKDAMAAALIRLWQHDYTHTDNSAVLSRYTWKRSAQVYLQALETLTSS